VLLRGTIRLLQTVFTFCIEVADRIFGITSIEDNGSLDGALVLDRLESFSVLLQFEGLVDNTLGLDFAVVQVVDGLR